MYRCFKKFGFFELILRLKKRRWQTTLMHCRTRDEIVMRKKIRKPISSEKQSISTGGRETKCEKCKEFYSTIEYENIPRSEERRINGEEPKAEKKPALCGRTVQGKIWLKINNLS